MAIEVIAMKSKVKLMCLVRTNAISCRHMYVPQNVTGTHMVTIFSFLKRRLQQSLVQVSCTSNFYLIHDAKIPVAFLKCSEKFSRAEPTI